MTYIVCNAVTRRVSHNVTRCVQNQNQNQTVVKASCGVCGSDQNQSGGELGHALAAPIGFGATR